MKKLRVALLYGGRSAEREVSLVSGEACAKAVRDLGHECLMIDPKEGVPALIAKLEPRPDVVFNALHGRWGEDGCIQGLLDLLELPYSHSGVLASALAMDKVMAKEIYTRHGLPVAESVVATREAVLAEDVMERPYVVKPVAEGSSVGVEIILPGANAVILDEESWPYGDEVMVERYVPGRELTVAVMGDRALAVTEILEDPNPRIREEAVKAMAVTAHRALGCQGVSRSDFRWDSEKGKDGLVILETNTQPGMTPLSLVPEQAQHIGVSFAELVDWMLEDALCRQ